RVRGIEIELVLEVAVAAAAPHRPDRAHAAVLLEAPALIQNQLAWALIRAGEQVADHRRARADGQGLRDVSGEADAAVGDHRDLVRLGRLGTVDDRSDHRDADAGHDAGRANRPAADADLDRIHALIDQRLGAFGGGHVAGNQIDVGEALPD